VNVKPPKPPTPAASRALERQPTNFDGLVTNSIETDGLIVTRHLSCACGSDEGRIIAGKGTEEVEWLDPLHFICSKCGAKVSFFDSQRDGYDGLLNGGACSMQSENEIDVECPGCKSSVLGLAAALFYNIEPDDLDECIEEDQKSVVSDFYDALSIEACCKKCGIRFSVGDWELA
jgi:hypothetical protein